VRYFTWDFFLKGGHLEKVLEHLLLRREEFVRGVMEIHDRVNPTLRRLILWFRVSNDEVVFTTEKTYFYNGSSWELATEPNAEVTVSFDAKIKTTGGHRVQFDIKGGWVIIYPNTDSVRIA
jgi:hypothetical protein